jgi:3-methyl-2-oxobutanoate hydroxymethyltransferase
MAALEKKFGLGDLRRARESGERVPMLTCYDYTSARLMQEAGVPVLLVGDSAANVILGHPTTRPVSLGFMTEIAAAVRRGAPNCFVVGDMPFGSYQGSVGRGVRNACRMVKLSAVDCVKLEVAPSQLRLVRELADAGVAVMAHLGLRPQAVGILGGYRYQGRTADEAAAIVKLAEDMERAGAAAILLEAVPPEVGQAVVDRTKIPVIGCGAGPACHGNVVVTHDLLGLTDHRPRFVDVLGDLASPFKTAVAEYAKRLTSKQYPAAQHQYDMPADEKDKFIKRNREGF